MSWPKPQFSRTRINKAGKVLVQKAPDLFDWFDATNILSNWRSCHGYPINTFQATLRDKLARIDDSAIIATTKAYTFNNQQTKSF